MMLLNTLLLKVLNQNLNTHTPLKLENANMKPLKLNLPTKDMLMSQLKTQKPYNKLLQNSPYLLPLKLINNLSNYTQAEFIAIKVVALHQIMEFQLSDTEFKEVPNIGQLKTHGVLLGVTKDLYGLNKQVELESVELIYNHLTQQLEK